MTARRLTVAAAVTLLALAASACSSGSSGGSATTPLADRSPSAIATATLAAARGAGSVEWVSTITLPAHRTVLTSFAGTTQGHQTVEIDGATSTVMLRDATVYLQGSAQALEQNGFPATPAGQLAGHWLSYGRSDQGYHTLAEGLTLGSVVSEIAFKGPVSVTGRRTIGGQQVIGLRGLSRAFTGVTQTVYVALDGPPLPVQVITDDHNQRSVLTFSHWGDPVTVTAPSPVIPIASLRAPVAGNSV